MDWIAGSSSGNNTNSTNSTNSNSNIHPVILAANKADLLPDKLSEHRIQNWVKHELEYLGIQSIRQQRRQKQQGNGYGAGGSAVKLISCKTGMGVNAMLNKARRLAEQRNCDIYVIGSANAGKSTLLNYILRQQQQQQQQSNKQQQRRRIRPGNMNSRKGDITTSPLPGTTLQFIKIDLGNGRSLYDTPGLLVPGTLTQLLTPEELKMVVPKR